MSARLSQQVKPAGGHASPRRPHTHTLPLRPSESASVGANWPVREGQPEARLTVWWALLMQRPTLPAPEGSGATACSWLAAEGTPSRHDGRGFLPVPTPPTPPPEVGVRQLIVARMYWLQGRKVAGCCI